MDSAGNIFLFLPHFKSATSRFPNVCWQKYELKKNNLEVREKDSDDGHSARYQIGAWRGGFLLLLLEDLGDSGDGRWFPQGRRAFGDGSGGGIEPELVGGAEEGGGRLLGSNWWALAARVLDDVDGWEGGSHGGHNSRKASDVIDKMQQGRKRRREGNGNREEEMESYKRKRREAEKARREGTRTRAPPPRGSIWLFMNLMKYQFCP